MKRFVEHAPLLMVLWFGAIDGKAQTFTNLYRFSQVAGFPSRNTDGATPQAPLILSGNVLYGTTLGGGTNSSGVVFAIETDGTGFRNLHTFEALSSLIDGTNEDGAQSYGSLAISGNTLFGTAYTGGRYGYGTVFKLNADGTGFVNLHSFTNFPDGAFPKCGLVVTGNFLYGTTTQGGTHGVGMVFRINMDGTDYTNLFSLDGPHGAQPVGNLVFSDDSLYGVTDGGGTNGSTGVIFKVSTSGTGFTNLFFFEETSGAPATNSTGIEPQAGLILSGNTLYGTTRSGGKSGSGAIYAINIDSTGFTNLHSFGPREIGGTNTDGVGPQCQLLLSEGTLYGTAPGGGANNYGTIYSLNTNGEDFKTVYNFTPILDGSRENIGGSAPTTGVLLSGNTLYGTTPSGGYNGDVYALILSNAAPAPIPLNASITDGYLVLTWSASVFSLQFAPSLTNAFTDITGAVSPYKVTVTNSQEFYRLRANE